ncbi:MAG: glycosyltransferase family 39 protein [Campylobacteraceae bacterium]|nr:glycosyltransferase family 39 protein [Campylobacteraceae bacterium]
MKTITSAYKYSFLLFFFLVLSALVYNILDLSISYKEALNFFINNSLLSIITNASTAILGQNDFGLRFPFLLFYILSVVLMYKLTEDFFKKESDRYVNLAIFSILPGLLSASILVNSAIIVTFFTLLYIYIYKISSKHSYILLLLFLFLDNSFAIFFLALFFYSLKKRDTNLLIVSLVLFGISMGIYGFDTGGKPKGFLMDTFAIYASIFSPLLFIYFFYSIYRIGIKENKTLTWYVSMTSLFFSLLLSFRQRIYIEDYAPFVVIFLPYMIRLFFNSIRIRLPRFRKKHYNVTIATLVILLLSVFLTLFNKPLYLLVSEPKKHFAYKYDFIEDIAIELKKKNINYINSEDEKLLLRLRFYGIESGSKYYITTKEQFFYDYKIDVSYFNKTLYTTYIIKENEK